MCPDDTGGAPDPLPLAAALAVSGRSSITQLREAGGRCRYRITVRLRDLYAFTLRRTAQRNTDESVHVTAKPTMR